MNGITLSIPGRGNLSAFLAVVGHLAAPSAMRLVTVGHDESCPCATERKPSTDCTCEMVDVTLGELP